MCEDYDGEGNQGPFYITYHEDKPCLTVSCHSIGYKRHLLLYLDCLIYDTFDTTTGWDTYSTFKSLRYKGIIYDSNDLKGFLEEILDDKCERYTIDIYFTDQDRVDELRVTCLNFTFKKPTWSSDPRDNV